MEAETKIKVLNRDNGRTGYSIPEMNGLCRVYGSGEIKEVTFEELQKLSYIPGGKSLLKNNLVILNNPGAVKQLLGEVEPEYSYTEADIKKLMVDGTLDEFLDCLDFAPQGVIDLIKKNSIDLPLNDVNKREAILNKIGFNVDEAIRLKRQSQEDSLNTNNVLHQRRVQLQSNINQEDNIITTRRVIKK